MNLAVAHPLHLSITNIDFEADSAKISIRVFDTNLFLHLVQCYPEATISGKADSIELAHQYSINYIQKSLQLYIENIPATLYYVNKIVDDGSVWYNFSALISAEIEKCTIENRILTECYDDQKNLTLLKKGKFERGLEFDSNLTRIEVILN
ncbi:MAG: DUF6702 family protein [Salinivirgaceae bacterium]